MGNSKRGVNKPIYRVFLNQANAMVRRNPFLFLLAAIFITVLVVVSLIDSPEEVAEKAQQNNEEQALRPAEDSVREQIEIDGFKFVKVVDMDATLTREENENTQEGGIFKVSGTAVLKDNDGKKHDDIPFQLYIDFYDGEFYTQKMVDIRYGYPLIEQLW